MKVNTGVRFVHVSLIELNFKLNKDFKPPKDGITIDIEFNKKAAFSKDKKKLLLTLSVALFAKGKNRPLTMNVSVEGGFEADDSEELKQFSEIHAPAHLFPFVREVIGNTTMRANIPPLLLPPFNLHAVELKHRKQNIKK